MLSTPNAAPFEPVSRRQRCGKMLSTVHISTTSRGSRFGAVSNGRRRWVFSEITPNLRFPTPISGARDSPANLFIGRWFPAVCQGQLVFVAEAVAHMTNGITERKQEVGQTAALANLAMFDKRARPKYVLGSPHLRYACVQELYASLVVRLFNTAKQHAGIHESFWTLEQEKARPHFLFSNSRGYVTAVDFGKPNSLAWRRNAVVRRKTAGAS